MASMGPRTLVRGNARSERVPETVQHASMGPQTLVRGNVASDHDGIGRNLASMGPRTRVRGNNPITNNITKIFALQWSRELAFAETRRTRCQPVRLSNFNGAANSR